MNSINPKSAAVEKRGWIRRLPPELPVFAFFLVATLFLTWPLVIRFTTTIYGIPSDNLGVLWQMWWSRSAAGFGASASFCPLVGFPFGSSLHLMQMEPVAELTDRFLLLFADEVVVYNLLTISGFFLSGVTMYYLVRYLTGDRRAAFFGGFAYLATGWHAYHALFFNRLAATQWMPLYILMLLKFIRKPTVKTAAFLCLSAVLVAGTSVHFGLFMAVFTASFLAGRFAHKRVSGRLRRMREGVTGVPPLELNRKTLLLSLLVILVLIAVLLPFTYHSFISGEYQGGEQQWPTTPTPGELRTRDQYVKGSARPLDYLRPDPYNPFLGRLFKELEPGAFRGFHGSLNVGWIVLALAALGMLFISGRGSGKWTGVGITEEDRNRHTAWGFLSAGLTCFIFSLRPFVSIGGVKIPLPSSLLSVFAPMFRWYLRLGIVVILCSIVLACYGLSRLLQGYKGFRREAILAVFAVVLALEVIIVPPFHSFNTDDVPMLVDTVAHLPKGAAVAYYPLQEAGTFPTSALLFYQRVSEKPMLNGANSLTDGETLRRTVYNPYNPATPGVLRRFDIEYAAYYRINENYYGRTELWDFDPSQMPSGLELVGAYRESGMFEKTYLFRVTAKPADLVPLYTGDFTVPRVIDDQSARLVLEEGKIRILNFTGADVTANARLSIRNLEHPRDVTVYCNGTPLWNASLDSGEETTAVIDALLIPPRGVDLELTVEGPLIILNEYDSFQFGAEAASVLTGDLQLDISRRGAQL